MGTPAVDRDPEPIHGVHHRSAAVVHEKAHRHPAGRHVTAESRIHLIQYSVGNHILCALKGFLRRLKHQPDPASQRSLILLQHLRRRQQHGGMEIVTAGMRLRTRGTGKTLAAFLRHGQRIHICPEQECFAAHGT